MWRPERIVAAVLVALLVGALARAAQLAWLCDDSFISLRYAQNLLDGHGLVYNAGERVEGYTNLLWTLLLAGLMATGLDPARSTQLPGLLCYALLALLLARRSWRHSPPPGGRLFLPLAAALVLVSDDFHVWATGGLETSLFTLLAVAGLLATRESMAGLRQAWRAGGLLALLVLTRPDGLLFAAAGAASWWLPPGRVAAPLRVRCALATLAPVLAVLVVLVPWKLAYYGELLPTAFYSKSAARPYLSQGLAYLAVYLARNWFLLLALPVAFAGLARARTSGARGERPDVPFFLATSALFAAYVVYVGGDFMAARRLVPAAPFLFLAVEDLLLGWPRRQGLVVSRALAGLPARVAFEGGMCSFGFYSRLPYLVEITGLTQYALARQPLERRGAIGHEKVASDEWLRRNGVHFLVSQAFPPVARPRDRLAVDEIYFGDAVRARILLYSDAIMDPLRGSERVDFVPIERVVELTGRRMARASLAEAEDLYAGLERFYFERAGERGEALARPLRARLERLRRRGSGRGRRDPGRGASRGLPPGRDGLSRGRRRAGGPGPPPRSPGC